MAAPRQIRHAVRFALVAAGAAGAVALSGASAFADGTPAPAAPTASVSAAPSASVSPAPASGGKTAVTPAPAGAPQVKTVPKGGAQTGEGETGPSTVTLVAGSGLAAVGATALGFAVVRRRAGAQG
ncbi:hypothetical protein CFP65_1256 [Kitasatospora sp. MMS16-BH015]|uniref:Tat pathway signal sequence domain protein n=1 Tax=Kitasatospora sp. MMS16-BH015 TaxID=2018025 RepID=UPI000CA31075|nr:Tat pathway signal sequence domain protein [Kitasatospora sp. MMS16-BH015]AUG76158.1 hypothetical protein CFP65_1256 [Kitasatospora sp. MMS16-BH015]